MSLMTLLERGIEGDMAVLLPLMRDIMTVVVYLELPVEKRIHPVPLLWFVDYLMTHAVAC